MKNIIKISKEREYTKEDIGRTIKIMLKNLHKNRLTIYKAYLPYHDYLEGRIDASEEVLKKLQRKYFKADYNTHRLGKEEE